MKNANSVRRLSVSCSLAAMALAASMAATASAAQEIVQTNPEGEPPRSDDVATVEAIIVTGTSIRGVAPVGSNLQQVGREQIEQTSAQTLQQVLQTIPSITAAGAAGQGPAGTSYYSPTIHSLGSSASNSTLVLIDGHRFSLGGQPHPLSDPNIIAPGALERVEVIADGASSVYGSDAVAGVINFITRRNFDGLELSAQVGVGDSYQRENASLLWGTRYDKGFVMFSYGYSNRSSLAYEDRDFLARDHRPQGGTNFQNFNCYPASIQPAGGLVHRDVTDPTGVANNTGNAFCNDVPYGDLLPEETRHNYFVKVEHRFTDQLTVGANIVYSHRDNMQAISRGGAAVTVFRDGPQANPFYLNPPGVTAASQTIRWQADELLGPGAYNNQGARNGYITFNAEYEINDNFRLTGLILAGQDHTYTISDGTLCGSCVNLALNGTTNTGGSLTQPSIPSTGLIVTQLPLTPDNALDVWNPAATNRTSAAVLASLTDSRSDTRHYHSIEQARLVLDGGLFSLPGGEVRMALGAEGLRYGMEVARTRPNNTGPASFASEYLEFEVDRSVTSVFGELFVPLVGPDNALPFVHSLDFNISGRYDEYSDVGSTFNPKYALNWEPVQGLRLRANWSQSFVAPAISSIGAAGTGMATFAGYGAVTSGNIAVPIANYPEAALLPGCDAPGQEICLIGNSTIQGISFNSGNPNLQPQTGEGWSLGVDFAPTWISGFRMQATLFNTRFRGGVTSPNLATVINTPGLNHLLTIYPTGATAADIAAIVGDAPQNSPIPSTVYFIRNGQQQNVVNLDIQGLDIDGSYNFFTDFGEWTVGASVTHFLKFDQNIGGGPSFSVLNSTGFNETFPSIQTQARAYVTWENGPFQASLFANHIAGYRNWSTTTVEPLTRDANGNPDGGGDKVDASTLIDLNLAWNFGQGGRLGDSRLFLDVTNLFDREPSFYNSTNGYDGYGGSPIGRVVTVGVRSRF